MYYIIIFIFYIFFFFQAEDGIRDGRVTGVQTCALPIWSRSARDAAGQYRRAPLPPPGLFSRDLRCTKIVQLAGQFEVGRWTLNRRKGLTTTIPNPQCT